MNEFEIGVGVVHSWFEHKELGDECAGCLWFDENKNLIDYDGVYWLPTEVIEKFTALGYNMSYAIEMKV